MWNQGPRGPPNAPRLHISPPASAPLNGGCPLLPARVPVALTPCDPASQEQQDRDQCGCRFALGSPAGLWGTEVSRANGKLNNYKQLWKVLRGDASEPGTFEGHASCLLAPRAMFPHPLTSTSDLCFSHLPGHPGEKETQHSAFPGLQKRESPLTLLRGWFYPQRHSSLLA